MTTYNLNILPIHRVNGRDLATQPGLLALTPPRRVARGREKDSLIVFLTLTGNAAYSDSDVEALKNTATAVFYQSAGTLTSAMRKAAESINTALLERNLASTGRGQYALGLLAIAAIRDEKCTFSLSGPTHVVWVGEGGSRHIHDPALSGKGLGSSQSVQTYLAQVDLHTNDLLVLCRNFPKDWEADLLGERPPASLEACYRKLTFTKGDLNAALVQPQAGPGIITILHAETGMRPQTQETPALPPHVVPTAEPAADLSSVPDTPSENLTAEQPSVSEEELDRLADFAAHMLQPSAYAIPPQPAENLPAEFDTRPPAARNFPPSIPRIEPIAEPQGMSEDVEEEDFEIDDSLAPEEPSGLPRGLFGRAKDSSNPDAHAAATRQMAKAMVIGIRSGRRVNESLGAFLRQFIPRLLPGAETPADPERDAAQQTMLILPTYALVTLAIIVPLLVVSMATAVYLRFGQSVQYDEYYSQALNARAQAVSETDPIRQRTAWQNVLNALDRADGYRETDESKLLRSEAQSQLDGIMGIARLEFVPAFTSGLGGAVQISRLAASESDLYMLDAEAGKILHASFTGRSLELDATFDCKPGTYAGYSVGTLVDLLALPKVNLAGASVLGVDATGTLLYCAPGQVPQAVPLPSLPNTNWGRITSFVLDGGNLYVLDATARAVWVFVGKEGTFIDTPYFYFGNQIPNTIDTAIDLAVSGDDLYLLHADGHLSTCTFSRISATPTRCIDPLTFIDPFPAHQDLNLIAQAHFTQMSLTTPPNSVILLLDSENQKVFRFAPRSLELQNQVAGHTGKANPFQPDPIGAMAVSPNYVLYLAIGDQVYFATNLP